MSGASRSLRYAFAHVQVLSLFSTLLSGVSFCFFWKRRQRHSGELRGFYENRDNVLFLVPCASRSPPCLPVCTLRVRTHNGHTVSRRAFVTIYCLKEVRSFTLTYDAKKREFPRNRPAAGRSSSTEKIPVPLLVDLISLYVSMADGVVAPVRFFCGSSLRPTALLCPSVSLLCWYSRLCLSW